jgi:hypothetical protein
MRLFVPCKLNLTVERESKKLWQQMALAHT